MGKLKSSVMLKCGHWVMVMTYLPIFHLAPDEKHEFGLKVAKHCLTVGIGRIQYKNSPMGSKKTTSVM